MNIPIPNPPAVEAGWTVASQIYRRICLARAKGRQKEADDLEATVFADVLAPLREGASDPQEWEERLGSLRQREEERAAQAAALAELLAPLLAEQLQFAIEAAPGTPAVALRSLSPRRAIRNGTHSIADFLDEMIAQNPAR